MTNSVIPPSFLFQYSLEIPRVDSIPRKAGRVLQLDQAAPLFVPSCMNDNRTRFELRMGWNTNGLGIQIDVHGKQHPPSGRRGDLKSSDFITICIDTRHTANVHRATEYCSSLIVLPADDDSGGQATAAFAETGQQRAMRRDQDGRKCRLATVILSDGYTLDLWVPAQQMPGFDRAPEIGKIGFHCDVQDTELGRLPLSIGDDFPVTADPSTWLQLELKDP